MQGAQDLKSDSFGNLGNNIFREPTVAAVISFPKMEGQGWQNRQTARRSSQSAGKVGLMDVGTRNHCKCAKVKVVIVANFAFFHSREES